MPCAPTPQGIRQMLPALEELAGEYERKRDAALILFNGERQAPCQVHAVLAEAREADLARRARRREAAAEALDETNPDELAHKRRTEKRLGAYAPTRPVVGLQSANVARRNLSQTRDDSVED